MHAEKLAVAEKFQDAMGLKKADRLRVIEWALWWDETLAGYYEKGLTRGFIEKV